MNSRFHFAAFLFGLWTVGVIHAEPARYHLDLSGRDPKAGDEGERTLRSSFTYTSIETNAAQTSTSNSFRFVELKGREKILTWDVSNDVSKAEMVVEHFVDIADERTNQLLKAGSKLAGNSMAGETFFRADGGSLFSEVQRQLDTVYNIRPRKFNQFAGSKLPPTMAIGETWKLGSLMAAETLRALGVSDAVEATGQFVAITNFSGIDCAHIRMQVESTSTPKFVKRIFGPRTPVKIDMQIRITVDLIVPMDASQRILYQSIAMDTTGSSDVDGGSGQKTISHSRQTTKMVDEFRPRSAP